MVDVPDGALASPGRRVAARLLDLLIVGAPVAALSWLVSDVDIHRRVFDRPLWFVWSAWTVGALYEVLPIALAGQTIGKWLMHIRVTKPETLSAPGIAAAVLRAVPALASPVPVIGRLLGLMYLPMFWRPRRQGLHDQLAGTIVVSTDY